MKDPAFVKGLCTAWMVFSVLKFAVVTRMTIPYVTDDENHDFESEAFVTKMFSMAGMFLFEESVMIFIQYFFYDKYAFLMGMERDSKILILSSLPVVSFPSVATRF